jgi:hypothetical protein
LAADSNTRVYYRANGTSGTISDAITFRAWDQTQNVAEGMYASTVSNGGKAEFSTATDTVAVTSTVSAGDTVIDLGASGKLIAPIQVGGDWFYFWDRSGDGTTANSGPLNGSNDWTTHDVLDDIFKYDINGVKNTTVANTDGSFGSTDVYRYGTINGLWLALPTNALATTLASSPPPGWNSVTAYWTSTPSTQGHKYVHFQTNTSVDSADTIGTYVGLQVISAAPPVGFVAPVVIDVNRDGVLSYGSVAMDVNGDGHLNQTAWAAAQDGVLVWDKFADGLVHDNSQYAFGQYATKFSVDAQGFARLASDLEGLSDGFDTNKDGVFDAADEKFAEFKVWQDADQDGVSDAGEVRSLADVGITQINLVSDGVQRTPAAGVTEAGRSTANLADGSTMLVADAAFAYSTATVKEVVAHVADQVVQAAEFENKPYELSAEELAQLGLPELAASLLSGENAELISEAVTALNLSGAGVAQLIEAVTEVASGLTTEELAALGLTETDVTAVIDAVSEVASQLPPAPEVCLPAAESSTYSLSNGQSLDLTQVLNDMSVNGIVKGLELVDMATDTSANVVSLSLADVLSMPSTDGVYKLMLTGAANDKVMLTEGEWTDTGNVVNQGGQNYAVYSGTNDSSAQLLIDQQMLQSQHNG